MNFTKLSKIPLAFFDFVVVRYSGTGTSKRIFIRLALKMIADVRYTWESQFWFYSYLSNKRVDYI